MGLLANFYRQNADAVGGSHQPKTGIVLPEDESSLGSACEHAVGFVSSFRDEIVNQHANVGVLSAEHKGLFTTYGKRGIDPRHDPLRGSFFVSCCAVDLSGKVKSGNSFRFKRMQKLARIYSIVLDCVGVCEKLGMLKSWDGVNELLLYLSWQTVGEAVWIDDCSCTVFRFQYDMMTLRIRKADNLILNRRTIAHTRPFNRAAIERTVL